MRPLEDDARTLGQLGKCAPYHLTEAGGDIHAQDDGEASWSTYCVLGVRALELAVLGNGAHRATEQTGAQWELPEHSDYAAPEVNP